jgi:hypothetical protein
MNKKALIKSAVAVSCLVVASMLGFKVAQGYGGSYTPTPCVSVTYADWQSCMNGMQFRNVIDQSPRNCQMTASQQLARSKSCGVENGNGQVLGEKTYADGTLLRGSDKKVYIVVGGKLKQITTLRELAKYAGKEIITVKDSVIASYAKVSGGSVLGDKKYGNGQLIRNNNVKVFVIIDGKKKHILNLTELAKYYFGKPIYHVSVEELASYPNY